MIRNIFMRERYQTVVEGESMTEQNHRNECNINSIIEKCRRTGMVPVNSMEPIYGDFSQVTDFHTAQNQLTMAQEAFYTLPPKIRQKFANDPGRLIEFLQDEKNRAEAEDLGLVERKPVVETPESVETPAVVA